MELIRNAEFVRGLGVTNFLGKVPDLRKLCNFSVEWTLDPEVLRTEFYYVLFPGASWSGKQWPVGNFAEVGEKIFKETGWRGIVCGGAADAETSINLCKLCTAPLLNLTGCTNLSQLATILSSAQMLLTNDTSATHISAACGVPTVVVLGGGHPTRFLPYDVEILDKRPLPRVITHQMPCFGCNWKCIFERPSGGPVQCIAQISVLDVWEAVAASIHTISG